MIFFSSHICVVICYSVYNFASASILFQRDNHCVNSILLSILFHSDALACSHAALDEFIVFFWGKEVLAGASNETNSDNHLPIGKVVNSERFMCNA